MSEGHVSGYEAVKEYLSKVNRQATRAEIMQAIGREVHAPDLTRARKDLGITWDRRWRNRPVITEGSFGEGNASPAPVQRKPKKRGRPRKVVVQQFVSKSPTGIPLVLDVIKLMKQYGADEVRQTAAEIAKVY